MGGKVLDGGSKYNATILSFLRGNGSNGTTKKEVILSGTASRIMRPVLSKRQKVTMISNCSFHDLMSPSGEWEKFPRL
jgi:hypothetical protein